MKTRKTILTTLVVIILLTFSLNFIGTTYADSTDDSVGTITVTSAAPSISSPELWNAAEDTDWNNTALSVNVEAHVNFTVTESNTLADLDNCTIIIWNNGGGTTEGSADSEQNHYTYTWTESTDTWAVTPSGFINTGNCKDPGTGSGETTFEFTLALDLSKVANYSAATSDWTIKIYVYDDSDNSDSDDTLQFGVASYIDISLVTGETTHTFSGAPGSNDNAVSAGGDGKVDVEVTTNAAFDVQVESLNATVSSNGNSFNIGNVTHYGSNNPGSSVALTTSFVDVTGLTGQTPPTAEASPATVGVHLWVDIPSGQPSGDYSYTLRVQVVKA